MGETKKRFSFWLNSLWGTQKVSTLPVEMSDKGGNEMWKREAPLRAIIVDGLDK